MAMNDKVVKKVSLEPYASRHQDELNYELDDVQSLYTVLPSAWFDGTHDGAGDVAVNRVAIMYDERAVGFFVLDGGDDKYNYTDNPKALLLRSMSLNPAYQGLGLSALALTGLARFCQSHVKQADSYNQIVLGVNHDNIAAQKVYEKVGFARVERTFMGRSGVQYVYELNI